MTTERQFCWSSKTRSWRWKWRRAALLSRPVELCSLTQLPIFWKTPRSGRAISAGKIGNWRPTRLRSKYAQPMKGRTDMTGLKSHFLRAGLLASALMIGSAVSASAETIKIGVFGPLTGDAAATGAAEKEAVDLAIKEKNAAGGIRGKQIEAVYADDAGKPEEAVNVAKRLTARDNVSILIGSISSPASLAASQIASQSQTPQIVVAGTAQKITTQGNKWVFRSPVPDTKLAGDLATFIHEKFPAIKKIAFLYVNDDFGRGGFEAFKAKAQEYGIEIVDEERYTRGDLDFTAQLGKIKASPAQAMIEWSRYTEGALVAKQFQQLGMTMPRFGSDGVAIPKYIELGGEAVNGVFYMTHYSSATTGGIPAAQVF